MRASTLDDSVELLQKLEERIQQHTHGRVRNLSLEEVEGQVVLRGWVPSRHAKQLALHAVLELVSGDRFREHLVVG